MKKNFLIDKSIALRGEDFYYDLHNSYLLNSVNLSPDENSLEITFKRIQGNWVTEDDPEKLKLIFENIRFLEISDKFKKLPEGVEEIGYKNEGDFDYDWLIREERATENDHLVLRLTNDEHLRVLSDRSKVYPS